MPRAGGLEPALPSVPSGAEVDAAVARVLAAERAAVGAVEAARARAAQQAEQARAEARRIATRARERIARAQARVALRLREQLAVIDAEARALPECGAPGASDTPDALDPATRARLHRAVQALAAALTGAAREHAATHHAGGTR